MTNMGRAFYSMPPECPVRFSWTYEIFIDPASLWIGCLVGCPLLIQDSGNKHSTDQTSMHTLGMWALEILYTGTESRRRKEDLI